MMKRKGETFTEFLVAIGVFGIMMGGLFEFMANQTETLADIRNRDELMFHANRYAILSRDVTVPTRDMKEGVSFDLTNDKKTLTVSNRQTSLKFTLKP